MDETDKLLQFEIKKSKDKQESDFRKWLIKYKPTNSVMIPIETNMSVGVPDIYCCYEGKSIWIECKTLLVGASRIRGSQYMFFKNLFNAGGIAKIAVQRLSPKTYKPATIQIYNSKDIITFPIQSFRQIGTDLLFPSNLKPDYTWHYSESTSLLMKYLLLDQ